jgi:hypothetical protein
MVIRKPEKTSRARKKSPTKKKEAWVDPDPTLLEDLLAIVRSIPEEEAAKLPRDGSMNHDHYIYGTPKKY